MTVKAKFLRWVEIGDEVPVAIFELISITEVSLEHLYGEGVPVPKHPSFVDFKAQKTFDWTLAEEYKKQQASAS